MGVKFNSSQYDKIFSCVENYKCSFRLSDNILLWQEMVVKLKCSNTWLKYPIIEIGCGTGQFAEMLDYLKIINKKEDYIGYDFSTVAIKMASERLENKFNFVIADVEKEIVVKEGINIVLIIEVLEHLDDFAMLELIPSGNIIFASVPDFDDDAHVRCFNSVEQVKDRYEKYIDFEYCYKYGSYFIFKGVKKN